MITNERYIEMTPEERIDFYTEHLNRVRNMEEGEPHPVLKIFYGLRVDEYEEALDETVKEAKAEETNTI